MTWCRSQDNGEMAWNALLYETIVLHFFVPHYVNTFLSCHRNLQRRSAFYILKDNSVSDLIRT